MKYACMQCESEMVTQIQTKEKEIKMSCPFCQGEVQAVAGPCDDNELLNEMGCLYPSGLQVRPS